MRGFYNPNFNRFRFTQKKLHLLDVKLEKLTPPGYQTLRNQNNIKLRFFIVLKFAIY